MDPSTDPSPATVVLGRPKLRPYRSLTSGPQPLAPSAVGGDSQQEEGVGQGWGYRPGGAAQPWRPQVALRCRGLSWYSLVTAGWEPSRVHCQHPGGGGVCTQPPVSGLLPPASATKACSVCPAVSFLPLSSHLCPPFLGPGTKQDSSGCALY